MSSTVTLRVEGLTCAWCIGDIIDRVHLVPGVVQVAVGPVEQGSSWVTVTSDPGVSVSRLARELSRGGFHIASSSGRMTHPDDHDNRRER
ncbi:MAG: heavy-metal-associated domain-containing protein [Candidatus Nanopelagicales bacterium]